MKITAEEKRTVTVHLEMDAQEAIDLRRLVGMLHKDNLTILISNRYGAANEIEVNRILNLTNTFYNSLPNLD